LQPWLASSPSVSFLLMLLTITLSCNKWMWRVLFLMVLCMS
jgi:hypothetical protein